MLLSLYPCFTQAQGMGAFYWGDADGNGIIGGPDVTRLNSQLNNLGSSDTTSGYYVNYPVSRYRQDTDGNGLLGGPDLSILNSWLAGDYSNIGGGAATIVLEASTAHVATGDSVLIGAYAYSTSNALRTGWGTTE